ncbi:MAG: hypothetical protein OXR67_10435 [Chloroflexota bacterium]|nr:hypothetical protein [Chloroflexota bacterium]
MSQENREPLPAQPEKEEGPSPVPPDELRPWYYQYWFLHPMIVFWPLWPVLIIRSPWHNGLVVGALAWAWLIIGGYLAFVRLQVGGTVALSTVAIVAPGLLFTVITQAHWIINRRRILNPPVARPDAETPDDNDPSTRSRRSLRRRRRRR